MRITSSGVYTRPQPAPKMPTGLVELMEDLTKDVLKHNPPNVYEFCANHMHQLLIVRDGHAPKQQLTLDQKIRKAQDTVKERAAKRRQKYDEEMKKINEALLQTEVQSNDCQKGADKEETLKDLIRDTNNLKAPVHHDQDLAKALEVEIFHKPLSLTKDMNAIKKESFENTNENITKSELTKIKNKEICEEMKQCIEMEPPLEDADNKNETQVISVETSIVKNKKDLEKASTEVMPDRKSLSSENKEEERSILNENAMDIITGLDYKETKVEQATRSENKDFAEVHDNIKKENATITDETTNVLNNQVSDILKTISTLENFSYDPQKVNNDMNNAKEQEKSNINNENTEVDTANDKNELEAIDDNISEAVQTTETTNESHDVHKDSSHDFVSQQELSKEIISENHIDVPQTAENAKPASNLEEPSVLNDTNKIEGLSVSLELPNELTDESTHNQVDVQILKIKNAENIDHKETEKIDETGKSDDYTQNDRVYKECVLDEIKVYSIGNESLSKKNEINTEQDIIDDTVTTVDKILVSESAAISDGNESPRGQTIEALAIDKYETTVNYSQETRHEVILENCSETSEHDNGDSTDRIVLKDDETIPITHDDLSIKIDSEKTDIDSSSMGKSSIDDSLIEESNQNYIEQETAQSNTEKPKDYPSTMDLETAAVTIQKVFRTFMFKSRGSTFDDTGVDDANSIEEDNEKVQLEYPMSTTLNKERRALGISRMDTVLQTVNEEKSLSLSTDDSSLSSAATIIQAHVRGFLVRNKLNSNKTNSASLINSDGLSTSFEMDSDQKANKTILNIHIVPEGDNFLSRDESLLTSIDLSLDGSPPSSTNLHPLGYDKSEPRKQLKREDAIQSISPPSNNSGKLSEDVDSVKDMNITDSEAKNNNNMINEQREDLESLDDTPTRSTTIETVIEAHPVSKEGAGNEEPGKDKVSENKEKITITKQNSDESDVITPYDEERYSIKSDDTSQLLHSGEFHDIVLPTKVSRSDTSVVREFKNVLVYFLLWNNS